MIRKILVRSHGQMTLFVVSWTRNFTHIAPAYYANCIGYLALAGSHQPKRLCTDFGFSVAKISIHKWHIYNLHHTYVRMIHYLLVGWIKCFLPTCVWLYMFITHHVSKWNFTKFYWYIATYAICNSNSFSWIQISKDFRKCTRFEIISDPILIILT